MYDMYSSVTVEEQELRRQREYYLKKQMDYEYELAKANMLNAARMDLAVKKVQMQEYRRAVRKAEYEKMTITQDGDLKIQTKNAIVELQERKLANFCFKEIFCLINSDGETGFFLLSLQSGERKMQVVLDESKIGKYTYIKRKLHEVGARFYSKKKSEEEKYLMGFWEHLCSQSKKEVMIPTHFGWIQDENGQPKFIKEGEILWKDILKKAK